MLFLALPLVTPLEDLCMSGSTLWTGHRCQTMPHWHLFDAHRSLFLHGRQVMSLYPFSVRSCVWQVSLEEPHALHTRSLERYLGNS